MSRANAHACREADARNPNVAETYMMIRIEIMTVVPATDCVALKKIWMNGKPYGVVRVDSGLPKQ